jgi:peptidoglycan/xylan/chitin deacetylase (PgdA/CDA1 family)
VATPFLMYHEIERAGRPLAASAPGYLRYVVSETAFAAQLDWMRSSQLRGVALGQARAAGFEAPGQVVITFDDGCESDLLMAAPLLAERGFGATFYVVSEWVGTRAGFLGAAQLRSLADAGFEIGSHSATHAFLSELGDGELRAELQDSKRELEDMLGRPVLHVSCPGGRWSRRVANAARDAGYITMTTSRIGTNGADTDAYALLRCAMHRDTPQHVFEAFCRGRGLGTLQLRGRLLSAAKTVLGNRVYGALRATALHIQH